MNTLTKHIKLFLIMVLVLLAVGVGIVIGRNSIPLPLEGVKESLAQAPPEQVPLARESLPAPKDDAMGTGKDSPATTDSNNTATGKIKWWTCSMHPQIKLPSGDMKCPICLMNLIPVMETVPESQAVPGLSLSERARSLAEVETAPVERREVTKTLRLVGKIQADETQLAVISARVAGRLDRLYADYTGMKVRKGDHLVELYSPELFSAQQELLQSVRALSDSGTSSSDLVKTSNQSLIEASKQKLVRLGLTSEQVEEVLKSGAPRDTVTLFSPTAGVVISREGTVGMYVEEGAPIYTVANLSTLWLILDAYESDMEWLHYGQQVLFETEAFPGEHFAGILSFISPTLDESSRTLKLRVIVPNPEEKLRPGLFVRATIQAVPVEGGKTMSVDLSGKWICPMHPEVIRNTQEACPVCGMPLETAESLGYQTMAHPGNLPLVIPDTAPLITGKRAVVYVEEQRPEGVVYTSKEVELGPHADGFYVISTGLKEGEKVVTHGNFKIDSALQILAKPSMMNPLPAETLPTSTPMPIPTPTPEAKNQPMEISRETALKIRPMAESYLSLHKALSEDSFENAIKAANDLAKALQTFPVPSLEGMAKKTWEEDSGQLKSTALEAIKATDIRMLREKFEPLSIALDSFVQHFGNVLEVPLGRVFCPMAFNNRGAFWIQAEGQVANPYFGSEMLRCGALKATYPPLVPKGAGPP